MKAKVGFFIVFLDVLHILFPYTTSEINDLKIIICLKKSDVSV